MWSRQEITREKTGWLTAHDWKPVRLKLDFIIRTLLDVRYRLKPSYPKGEVVRADEVFWLNNDHNVSITEMDRRLDRMADKIIKECKNQGNLVDIDEEDADRSDSTLRNISSLPKKGTWSSAQRVKMLTPVGVTGRLIATSRQCAFPNDLGVQKPTK